MNEYSNDSVGAIDLDVIWVIVPETFFCNTTLYASTTVPAFCHMAYNVVLASIVKSSPAL